MFLSTLRSRSSRFGNNVNVQKFIIIVKTNMKAPEIIDCTCTVASISSISRFACANVWSVRVVTKSIYVTFVGICFAFVNICQKKNKEKKRKEWKTGFVFYSKVIHVHVCEKKWNTRLQFFCFIRFLGWTYNSNRYFSMCFSGTAKTISSIRYKLLLFCNGSTKHVIYTKKGKNEL